ncbi:unnamed protein product [Rhizopus stolonifer]
METSVGTKRLAEELDIKQLPAKKPAQFVVREPSIFNIKPVDDVIKYIADFIGKHCHLKNVEIEAKFGVFVDKHSKRRINLNAHTETILTDGLERNFQFELNMPLEQHCHFNKLLNEWSTKRKPKTTNIPDTYTKWRVTTDSTGKNLVNVEHPRPLPKGDYSYERAKDRISYKHGGISFDLTQVKTITTNDPDLRHELELEILNSELLAAERLKYSKKEQSQYTQMIEVFVNNIRLLGRSAVKQ